MKHPVRTKKKKENLNMIKMLILLRLFYCGSCNCKPLQDIFC